MKRMSVAVACVAFLASAASALAAPSKEPPPPPPVVPKAARPGAPAVKPPRRVRAPVPATPSVSPPTALPSVSPVEPSPPYGRLPTTTMPVAAPGDLDQALLTLQVFRVRGDIVGETSLTDNLWEGIKGEDLEAIKGPFSFFTLANLTVAGVKLRASQTRWSWDGKDQPDSGTRVELFAQPRLMVALGESFEIEIGSQQPIEYFEKRSDGLFELKTIHEQTGLALTATVEAGEAGRLAVRNLTITLRSIEKRKPIEGVSLDVGEPTIKTREYKISIAVKPGQYYGIQLATEGYGFLILRLRADLAGAHWQPTEQLREPPEPSSF